MTRYDSFIFKNIYLYDNSMLLSQKTKSKENNLFSSELNISHSATFAGNHSHGTFRGCFGGVPAPTCSCIEGPLLSLGCPPSRGWGTPGTERRRYVLGGLVLNLNYGSHRNNTINQEIFYQFDFSGYRLKQVFFCGLAWKLIYYPQYDFPQKIT